MLNLRLYRTSWLVAGVALVVALLTLQTPDPGPEPSLPSTIDGQETLLLDSQLRSIAPERPPGSAANLRAARFVEGQLAQVPGATAPGGQKNRVQQQDFQALRDGEPVDLQNVYLVVPGVADGRVPGGIVVVAPRDTPAGVSAGTSATAVMLRLARASGTTRHQRPHLFVSTDGSTIGNAGLRWFLSRFSAFPISAVVVLDAPGEENGDRVHVWTAGRTDRHALGLGNYAGRSVERVGGRRRRPALDQRPAAPPGGAADLRRAGRRHRGRAAGRHPVGALRVAPAGGPRVHRRAPRAGGQRHRGPPQRARRDPGDPRGRRQPPLRREVPAPHHRPLRAAAARCSRCSCWPSTSSPASAGPASRSPTAFARWACAWCPWPPRWPPPTSWPSGACCRAPPPARRRCRPTPGSGRWRALAIILCAAAALLGWRATRRAARRIRASRAAEGTAALGAMAVVLVALWILSPYALILAVPIAHAALLATGARQPWHLVALGGLALLPLLALALHIAGILHSNAPFAVWYLFATSANGSRGATGVLLALLFTACVWAIVALVAEQASKGALGAGPRGRPRRPRRPLPRA